MKKATKSDNYNNIFPTHLRDLMEKNNTKQSDLAKLLNVSRQAVAQYKDGKAQPNMEMIATIAKYFNVSSDYLLGLTDIPTSDKDLKAVCEYTGLNEEAIKNITEISENEVLIWLLSDLLSSYDLKNILQQLHTLHSDYFKIASIIIKYADILGRELNLSIDAIDNILMSTDDFGKLKIINVLHLILSELSKDVNYDEEIRQILSDDNTLLYAYEKNFSYNNYCINTAFSTLIKPIYTAEHIANEFRDLIISDIDIITLSELQKHKQGAEENANE